MIVYKCKGEASPIQPPQAILRLNSPVNLQVILKFNLQVL